MELKLENLPHLVNKCGIYELIINKKSYIGSSLNLRDRLREHLNDLNNNNHSNKKLLNAFNKYKHIYFGIIEFCNLDILIDREEYWYSIKGYYNLQNPKKTINRQCKIVYKFSMNQEYLEEYISSSEAARLNNIPSAVGISSACRKKTYYASGFLWSYEKEAPFRNNKAFIPVYMFKTTGELVKKFSSSYEAARYLIHTFNLTSPTEHVGGRIKQSIKKGCLSQGFLFSKTEICPKLAKTVMRRPCYLKEITTNNVVKEFKNVKEASLYFNKSMKTIYNLIYRKTKIDKTKILTY
jgi:group I intron endonuclease